VDYAVEMQKALDSYHQPRDAQKVFVFGPKFCNDSNKDAEFTADPHVLRWHVSEWSAGEDSINEGKKISSYAVLDQLISSVIEDKIFPNLKHIVFAGHSAGGQFVQRYSMLSHIVEKFQNNGITFKFVAANPGSYVYLNEERPKLLDEKTILLENDKAKFDDIFNQQVEWINPSASSSSPAPADYNDWKFGLANMEENVPYLEPQMSREQLIDRYMLRDVEYLAGLCDTHPGKNAPFVPEDEDDKFLDVSPQAQLQGRFRLERAILYFDNLKVVSGGNTRHRMTFVPKVAHDHTAMFNSPEGKTVLFKF